MAGKKIEAEGPKDVAFKVMRPVYKRAEVVIEGTTPLITHKWSEKAKKMMLDKQQKKAVEREAKDIDIEFHSSYYRLPDGGYGFPAIGVKMAMVRAGKLLGVAMTDSRCAFHVDGEFIKIEGSEPEAREDMVRLSSGVADIRYRAQFTNWKSTITLSFNSNLISLDDLKVFLESAGFSVGIGEWRPEKNGRSGMFRVVSIKEI